MPKKTEEAVCVVSGDREGDPSKILEVYTTCALEIKQVFERLSHLIGECNLVFVPPDENDIKSEGLRVETVAAERNLMIRFKVPAANLDFYKCTPPGDSTSVVAGIDISEFYGKLKNIDDSDAIYLYMNEADSDFLHIECEGDKSRGLLPKKLTVKLMDVESEDSGIDRFEFESKISVQCDTFQKMCKNMSAVSDRLIINSSGKTVSFSVSNDSGAVTNYYDTCKSNAKSDTGAIFSGKFNMKHILIFAKCNKLCNKITLYLRNGEPLVINVDISRLGRLVGFLIAENEEDFD